MMRYIYLLIWFLILLTSFINAQQLGATSRPPKFPSHIELRLGRFINWSQEYLLKRIWIASPSTEPAVVDLANWAFKYNYNLRPFGAKHGWSPLVISPQDSRRNKTILIDTKYLKDIKLTEYPNLVSVQSGVTLLDLLTFLEENGKGLASTPAIGVITVGGMLAIGAHGAGIQNKNEKDIDGYAYGSFSNLVELVTFVRWNKRSKLFQLQTLDRFSTRGSAVITNLGRIFVTNVVIEVVPNFMLRCQSRLDIPNKELFANPDTTFGPNLRTIDSFLEKSGRIETIQYPFTEHPWVKVWTRVTKKPLGSRWTNKPYNYLFTDRFPFLVSKVAKKFITGKGNYLTPAFTSTFLVVTAAAIPKYKDLYGWSKNTMLYIKPTTMRYFENSHVILTESKYVQKILSELVPYANRLIKLFAEEGKFPINGPIEIRVTGLDFDDEKDPGQDIAPGFSSLRPDPSDKYKIAIWFGILTFPDTPHMREFFTIWERHLYTKYSRFVKNATGLVRPEWSKGWNILATQGFFPANNSDNKVARAAETLRKFDPKGVFLNDLLKFLIG